MSAARKTLPRKPYWEMTTEELAEATKEFDNEMAIDTFRELTPAERAHWEHIQRNLKLTKREPRSRVTAQLPRSLIKQLDALAHEWQCSRGHAILIGLQQFFRQRQKKS